MTNRTTEEIALLELADKLVTAELPKRLKFGLYKDEGWVTASSASTIRLLCDVWNNRQAIALAVRSHLESPK